MANKLGLLENQNALDESLLRSAFLLSANKCKSKQSDQYRRAILAVIIYGINEGGYDASKITLVFNDRFHLNESVQNIQHQINLLIRDNYIKITKDGKYVENDENKKGVKYFEELKKNTTTLIDKVVTRVCNKHRLNDKQKEIARLNTKNALSAFFQMNALAMFDLQKQELPQNNDAILKLAMKGLDVNIGKYLVSVLAYIIETPEEQDKVVLGQWAKAVIAMRSTNLDPLLRNFKQQQIANKKFILDTDVLLNLLCKNARYSEAYRMMVSILVSSGSDILIPDFVKEEVKLHASSARYRFSIEGSQCMEYSEEMLEGPKSNVFIEDYVKTLRKEPQKKGMSFDTYMGNICSNKSDYVLNENIKRIIGEKNGSTPYTIAEKVLVEEKANELKEIIKTKAMDTPKGWGRSLEQLEESALNDTRLYLTIRNDNLNVESKGLLGFQCYLLTRSVRTIVAATEIGLYDKHVVCHPQSLISVLEEIGILDDVEVINLFDNPFLTYTAELIWDQVEPVIKAGAQIGYSDFIQLREKYDLHINDILTEDMAERQKLAEKYHKEGLLFAKDWHELFNDTEKTKEILEDVKKHNSIIEQRNEKLENENAKLKKENHYYQKLMKKIPKGRKITISKRRKK